MPSLPSDPGGILLCVPTELERTLLERVAPDLFPGASSSHGQRPGTEICGVELVGFGPVAAAARTAGLIARWRPARILLIGIAGRLEGGPAVGEAEAFGAVALDGVGAGHGADLLLPSDLGFPQWQDEQGTVEEHLTLSTTGPLLLSVCGTSADEHQAAARSRRFQGAAAEDMETFGAALAARMAHVPLHAVRGISNVAGDRHKAHWQVEPALEAAAIRTRALLEGLRP